MEAYLERNNLNTIHDLSSLYEGDLSVKTIATGGPYWLISDVFLYLGVDDKYVLHGHDINDTLIITRDDITTIYVNETGVLLIMLHVGITTGNNALLKSVTDYICGDTKNVLADSHDENLGPFALTHLYAKYIGKPSNSGTRAVSVMFNPTRLAKTNNDIVYIGTTTYDIAEKVSMRNKTSIRELMNELDKARKPTQVLVSDAVPENPMREFGSNRKNTDYVFTEVVHIFKTDPRMLFDIIGDDDIKTDQLISSPISRTKDVNDSNIVSVTGKVPNIRKITLSRSGVIRAALLSTCPSIRRLALDNEFDALTSLLKNTLLEVKYLCRSKSNNVFYSDNIMKSSNITDCVPVYDEVKARELLMEEGSMSNIWYYIVHRPGK